MATATKADPRSHSWNVEDVHRIINSSNSMICVVHHKTTHEHPSSLIHRDLLCFFSPYYDVLLSGVFGGDNTEEVVLGLTSTRAQFFISWLYTGQLLCSKTENIDAIELYAFADEKSVTALRRAVITTLVRRLAPFPLYRDVSHAYRVLPASSPLCRFYVESHVRHWKREDDDGSRIEAYKTIPPEFTHEVMTLYWQQKTEPKLIETSCSCHQNPCHYHEHKDFSEWQSSCGRDQFRQAPKATYYTKADSTVKLSS